MGKLFGNIDDLKVGIASGEHVIHIIKPDDTKSNVIYEGRIAGDNLVMDDEADGTVIVDSVIENDTAKVTQGQVYSNKSNKNTAEFFVRTAVLIDDYYEKADPKDKEFKNMLEKIRDYLVADSRSGQQKASEDMIKSIQNYVASTERSYGAENDIRDVSEKVNFAIDFYENLQSRFTGNMKMDSVNAAIQKSIRAEDIEEPSYSGFTGAMSFWSDAKNKQLFPHEPNATDIKQGLGIQDCYMHSCLIKLADTDPDKIKNAMKDNGDGTVTVRFYDNEKDPETDEMVRTPVYVRVKKTESNVLGIGASYASGSLWVQMMEKAYAKYNDMQEIKKGNKPKGLAGISLGNAKDFLNAFEEEPVYQYMFTNSTSYEGIGIKNDGTINNDASELADLYCDQMYDFLQNNSKEPIVVGAEQGELNGKIKALGIRTGHAYPIMKVFEDNGEKYVQLRDPYATYEAKYDENGKLIDATSNMDWISRGIHSGGDNMGTFNLKMRDFAAIFTNFSSISKDQFADYQKSVLDVCKAKEKEINNKRKEDINKNINNNEINIGPNSLFDGFEIVDGVDKKAADNKPAKEVDGFDVIDENDFKDNNVEVNQVKAPERDEYGKIRHAMENFLADLTRVESKYRNSDIYKNLKKAVADLADFENVLDNILIKDEDEEYRKQLNKISDLVDQYVDHKKKGADLTSQNKLAVAIKLKAYVDKKVNPEKVVDNDIDKVNNKSEKLKIGEKLNFKSFMSEMDDDIKEESGVSRHNSISITISPTYNNNKAANRDSIKNFV